jgi:hypothetical protein
VVHTLNIDAKISRQLILGGLDHRSTAQSTHGARRFNLFKIPRTSLKAIGRRRERTNRTDLNNVAREVRAKRQIRECGDLDIRPSSDEFNQGLSGHFIGKARATIALYASLPIEQDELRDRYWFRIVTLFFDKARLARTEREGLVLERALATFVTDGTVERVISE